MSNLTLKNVQIRNKYITYQQAESAAYKDIVLGAGETYFISVANTDQVSLTPGVYSKTGDGSKTLSKLDWDYRLDYYNESLDSSLTQLSTDFDNKLTKKADNYSVSFSINGFGDGTHGVKFLTIDYSSSSTSYVYAKLKLISGHPDEMYNSAQQLDIHFSFNPSTNAVNINASTIREYADATSSTTAGVYRNKHYGDIFYVQDADNHKVHFYIIMGQYSNLYMTPIFKIGGKASLTQITSYGDTSKYSGAISAATWIPLAYTTSDEFSTFSGDINTTINSVQSAVSTNNASISTLSGKLDTAQESINSLVQDITSHTYHSAININNGVTLTYENGALRFKFN